MAVAAYLSQLPPDHTTASVVLYILTPLFALILSGFAWAHASDVRAGR